MNNHVESFWHIPKPWISPGDLEVRPNPPIRHWQSIWGFKNIQREVLWCENPGGQIHGK